jgi:hypothetical protein
VNPAQQYIAAADTKLTQRETHRRRAVAAAAALVKHQLTMRFA